MEMLTMETMMKDWFDAVGSGNIVQMQQLIRNEIPVDSVNEVNLGIFFFFQVWYYFIVDDKFTVVIVLLLLTYFCPVFRKKCVYGFSWLQFGI